MKIAFPINGFNVFKLKWGIRCNFFKFIDFAGTALLDQAPEEEFRKYVFAEHNWHDFRAHERMVRTKKFLFIENNLPLLDNRGAADVMNGDAGMDLRKKHLEGG